MCVGAVANTAVTQFDSTRKIPLVAAINTRLGFGDNTFERRYLFQAFTSVCVNPVQADQRCQDNFQTESVIGCISISSDIERLKSRKIESNIFLDSFFCMLFNFFSSFRQFSLNFFLIVTQLSNFDCK